MTTSTLIDFDARLAVWLDCCQELLAERFKDHHPDLPKPTLVAESGRRYIRIVQADPSSRSAWAFIDTTNGDVLKPAGWKTPAKHARGNIFDESNGLKWMSGYGPAYLK